MPHTGARERNNIEKMTTQELIALHRAAPDTLARLIEGQPAGKLKHSPAPGKWSVCAILAHLADDELVTAWRYRQMIENDGAVLAGFDQDEWARLGAYDSWEPTQALALFRQLREANLRMLERLTPQEWQRRGIHAERGPMTVQSLAGHMAGHDKNHIEQIKRILGGTA